MAIQARKPPFPRTENELIRIMRERRYWDERHPEFRTYQRVVREGFERLFPGPLRYDAGGAIVEAPRPKPGNKPPFIFVPENPPREDRGEGLLGLTAGRSGGTVHVHAYARIQNGETVQVAEHDRAAPQGSGGATDRSKSGGDSPQKAGDDDLPPMVNPVPGGRMRGNGSAPSGTFPKFIRRRTAGA